MFLSPYSGLDGKCSMSDDELKECFGEVLDICRIILEDCTDDDIRYNAISLQIMIYKMTADKLSIRKAVECANRLPPHFTSKHAELARIYGYETEEEILLHQQYTQNLVASLCWEMRDIVEKSEYPTEKKIFVCKKALALHRLIYDDEDYGVEAQTIAHIYENLSGLYLEAKDSDSALDALEKYVKYNLMSFDALDNGFVHTSLLFDHLTFEKGNYSRSFTESPAEFLLHRLNRPIYDGIRETERFQNIIKQLM